MGRHGGGVAAGRWLQSHLSHVAVLEQRTPPQLPDAAATAAALGWPWHVGNHRHPALGRADLLIPSPAVPPRQLAVAGTLPAIASPEAMFIAAHRGPRIAVTGTKGKSTTAAICGALLGWQVAGNSYEPLLSALARLGPDAPLVCELSSFQLWYLGPYAPRFDGAVLTNLGSDHLDWHGSVAHYHAAKLALLSWVPAAAVHDGERHHLPAGPLRIAPVHRADGYFRSADGTPIAPIAVLQLPGEHNRHNAELAIALALHLGVPSERIAERLATVRPLPHRLQLVHRCGDLAFIDDSIATTPESAIAGLAATAGPVVVILGGHDKGADFSALARTVAERRAAAVCIGATGPALRDALAHVDVAADLTATLEDALQRAVAHLQRDHGGAGTILLSPACASFGMFADFEERGDRFAAIARKQWPAGPDSRR
jgi:UDP-N-acetylmuramoylalanine--D-glutamate ligase